MSDSASAVPEPTEEDEQRALAFLRLKEGTTLQGEPRDDQRCGDCSFLLDRSQDISYCWNDAVEILVGREWWCDRYAPVGTVDAEPAEADRQRGATLHRELVEDEQWVNEPRDGERCDECLFYLDPGTSVSYCWNPHLQVGVGADHWCRNWQPAPATQADAY